MNELWISLGDVLIDQLAFVLMLIVLSGADTSCAASLWQMPWRNAATGRARSGSDAARDSALRERLGGLNVGATQLPTHHSAKAPWS